MCESGVMQRHVKDGAQQEHPAVNEAPVSPHFTPLRFPCLFDDGGGVVVVGVGLLSFIHGCNVTTR